MSLPTWPLLRSRWALIARAQIQQQLKISPQHRTLSSTSQVRYGATLSFRHSHSFADTTETTTTKTNPEFPINIIEGENSIRRFAKFVEEGELDEARKIMADFVSHHPADGNMDLFRQLQSIIIQPKAADLSLVLELAGLLASKGHLHFVKDEIRPVVEDQGSDDMLSSFDIFLAEIELRNPPEQRNTSVFEEPSDDYATILSESPPHRPSVIDLVQVKLPALLPELSTNDISIFEVEGAEYAAHISSIPQEHTSNTNTKALADLLQTNSYDRAYTLLKEMQNLGTAITPSHVFEKSAVHALRNILLSPSEQAEQFLDWLALVPPYHFATGRQFFAEIRFILLQSPVIDISLLKRCLLLLGSKGYHRMSGRFLPTIIRHSSFAETREVMRGFERGVREYWRVHEPAKAQEMGDRTARDMRRIAVRALAWSGRLHDAVALLPRAKDNNIYLTAHTYDILLSQLKKSTLPSLRRLIPLVEDRRSRCIARSTQPTPLAPNAPSTTAANTQPLVLQPPTDPDDLGASLRFLAHAIAHQPTALHPHVVANFIAAYLASGRPAPGVLKHLNDTALRTGFVAARAWVLGEMQYYRRMGEHELVLKTFVEHFHLDGVPAEEVREWYAHIQAQGGTGKRRVSGFDAGGLLPFGKMWPRHEHTAMVWEVLVLAARSDAERLQLYERLLAVARGAGSGSGPVTGSTRRNSISGAAFMPFLQRLPHIEGASFGTRLLTDMHAVDLRPSAHHYAAVLYFWARGGHNSLVFALLDRIGSGHAENATFQEEKGRLRADGSVDLARRSFQRRVVYAPPDMGVYVSAIRGFVRARDVKSAEEVVERLQTAMGVDDVWAWCGEDAYLDRALEELRVLKASNLPTLLTVRRG